MTWNCDLKIAYYQQETNYCCGAAVAQMILAEIGATKLSQKTLYNSNNSHNQADGWFTDPEGLDFTLDHFKPTWFDSRFVIREKSSEIEQSKGLVYTLYNYKVAAAALVLGGAHWVVVRGANTTKDPASSSYAINGFYVNDPWPPSAGKSKGPGHANTYITYANWKSRYMKPVVGNDVWAHQYITVHHPRQGELGELEPTDHGLKHDGSSLVDGSQAREFAKQGGQQHGLHDQEDFGEVLSGGNYRDGLLVQSLDRRDDFYSSVPIEHAGGLNATVMVDGRYGNLLGVHKHLDPLETLVISAEKARQRVLSQAIDFGDERGLVSVREEVLSQHPSFVWQPCRESRTPFHPFHMFHVGADRVYVGYDGTVYPNLTPLGRG